LVTDSRQPDHATWRWCFYINLPIGGASLVIIFFFFQTPEAAKPVDAPLKEKILQMDPLGTFVIMGAIVCILLALQWGGVTKPWGDSQVIGTLVGFGVIVIGFVILEWRLGEYAMLVPRLLKQRTVFLFIFFLTVNFGAFLILMYYLPIYFQVVAGVSASQSGVRNVPLILGISLFTIVSGIVITVTRHYIPFLILGGIFATVGNGVIYTLGLHAPAREWIGYQVISGIGTGLSIQVPMIVAQAIVDTADLSSVTAIIMFFQTLAGAVFIQIAQSLFANKLVSVVPRLVPGVDPALVVGTGATDLRKVFTPEQLPGVIQAYLDGLHDTYILAIALAGMATVFAFVILIFDYRTLKGVDVAPGGSA
jgi:MFS transporter, DHA2 family, glioxin efflux transporter